MTRLQLVDCPECACLIAADEKACPFCGAAPRRYAVSSVLGIGFMLGLATASCGEKDTGTQGATETTTHNTDDSMFPTTAYAGPSPSTSTDADPTDASASAYAGPDSGEDSGPPDTDDTVTSTTHSTDMGGTSAYAGPASTSTASETDPGTSTDTDAGTGTGTGTDTGTTG